MVYNTWYLGALGKKPGTPLSFRRNRIWSSVEAPSSPPTWTALRAHELRSILRVSTTIDYQTHHFCRFLLESPIKKL